MTRDLVRLTHGPSQVPGGDLSADVPSAEVSMPSVDADVAASLDVPGELPASA